MVVERELSGKLFQSCIRARSISLPLRQPRSSPIFAIARGRSSLAREEPEKAETLAVLSSGGGAFAIISQRLVLARNFAPLKPHQLSRSVRGLRTALSRFSPVVL